MVCRGYTPLQSLSSRLPPALVFTTTAFALAVLGYFASVPPASSQGTDAVLGRDLYLANCARCHGVNLEGQPNWMKRNDDGRLPAPPHDETGHTWHHSDKQLFRITKFGLQAIAPGYESDMPTFGDVLTDEEINSILDYIKSTWPKRQQEYQSARSKSDE